MSGQNQPRGGGILAFLGSAVILFFAGIIGTFSGKKSFGNASDEEQKAFSGILNAMKEDMERKKR